MVIEELNHFGGKWSRKQKRKRTLSATSYLEPAVFEETADDGNAPHLEAEAISPEKLAITSHSEILETTAKPDPPMKNPRTYEKKPRHKTREDRYELKRNRMKKPSTKAAETTSRSKNKRKERSGAALSHSFTAKNVEPDRLTVRISTVIKISRTRLMIVAKTNNTSWTLHKRTCIFPSAKKRMSVMIYFLNP